MAQTSKESIVPIQLGKWGIKVGNEWYNYSKKFTDHDKLQPGVEIRVEVYQTDTGKKYLNKVLDVSEPQAAPAVAPAVQPKPITQVPVTVVPPVKASVGRDFDKEARGKTRCAAICAAIQSPAGTAYAATEQEYIGFIKRIADTVVNYTFEDSYRTVPQRFERPLYNGKRVGVSPTRYIELERA